ncbi:hypothetical protein P7K49_011449 [Saguinus oedipus]|uniref:Uncharacterized protein n=1 Tax=Saguinus oedipus TaxID=9490 RepID=A0ABQ9VQQ0_SAGOE|nr:hypothetical protein P7K49_011449 [Saguinus oedipus]
MASERAEVCGRVPGSLQGSCQQKWAQQLWLEAGGLHTKYLFPLALPSEQSRPRGFQVGGGMPESGCPWVVRQWTHRGLPSPDRSDSPSLAASLAPCQPPWPGSVTPSPRNTPQGEV